MKPRFEVWDVETSNVIDAFPNEDAALAFVRSAIDEFGDDYARTLALLADEPAGDVTTIAIGAELTERAHAPLIKAVALRPSSCE
jgi:hypothetical protein